MTALDLPPQQWIAVAPTPDGRLISLASEESVEARERILMARIAELEAQRDFLVEEYERAVKCGKQGYLHCAMHLFNAIANARVDAIIAAREKKE